MGVDPRRASRSVKPGLTQGLPLIGERGQRVNSSLQRLAYASARFSHSPQLRLVYTRARASERASTRASESERACERESERASERERESEKERARASEREKER